jgi:hypothetical protein
MLTEEMNAFESENSSQEEQLTLFVVNDVHILVSASEVAGEFKWQAPSMMSL